MQTGASAPAWTFMLLSAGAEAGAGAEAPAGAAASIDHCRILSFPDFELPGF